MVRVLVNAGANVNAALPAGETVLMTCARTGNVDALKILIARGADVNAAETWREQTVADVGRCRRASCRSRGSSLLEHGADLHARSREISALGSADSLRVTRTTPTRVIGGFTAFLFAVREGASNTAKVLLDAGGEPHGDRVRTARARWSSPS